MPIRLRQKMQTFKAWPIYGESMEVNPETHVAERKKVDYCAVLPDSSTTDLDLMLKAGVPLQQVDCKLIDPKGTLGLKVDDETQTSDDDKE